VRVNGLPNQPACRVIVRGGERVETQNVLGTRETDLLAAADFLFPQGIDHHRLMAGVRGVSALVGGFARRVAGLGKLADHAPPPLPADLIEVPVLIVGGGPTGLTAAAELGPRATLVDDGLELGGALTALEPQRGAALAANARAAGATCLERSTVVALSRETEGVDGRLTALVIGPERSLVARCRAVLLATGRHDAAPAFPNNDLPGIFSARAALFAWRNDVLIGSRIALVGSGRFADTLVSQLSGAVELVQLDAESVLRARGRERISAVEARVGDETRRIKVDALAFDGLGAPSFELAVQSGAQVDFEPSAGYVPRAAADGSVSDGVFVSRGDVTLESIRRRLAG
jgi:sarcosine oxidase, subunit alpha